MDCRDFRKLVSRMIDAEATRSEEEKLMLHLGSCRECREFHESLAAITGLHRGLARTEPSAGLLEKILALAGRVEGMPGQADLESRHSAWWKAGIAAAAAAVILLGVKAGGYVMADFGAAPSVQQAEVTEMDYLGAFPPGSLGETLLLPEEGGDDV